MKIKTNDFTFSKQAKKLPKFIEINENFAYILGLWKADRCSTAKGIVGLRSKDKKLIEVFRDFIKKMKLEVKERTVSGYGITREVYCCSMPLRRIFETISSKREQIFNKLPLDITLSYLAGLIDGDGSIEKDKSGVRISYSKNNIEDVKTDSSLINKLNLKTTIKKRKNYVLLYILKPKIFIPKIKPFLILKFSAA